MDYAHKETDKLLKALEKRITQEYRQAKKEIQEKLDDYFKRFATKDKIWRGWVADGVKTKKQYEQWRIGQMAIGRRWEEQKRIIAQDIENVNQIARNILSEMLPNIYALNHNYGTYEIEQGAHLDTSYVLYDRDTVEGLFKDGRKLYHDPGKAVSRRIAAGMEDRWIKQNIQSLILQGIIQGETIAAIATRIANEVGEQNRKVAIRNARTITTGVENKGRIDSYKRANKMGIKTKKQWLATLDGRTRHYHRLLDGQVQDVDKPFVVEGEEIMFPGDPDAEGYMVYNCRCTLIADIEGFENDARDLSLRNTANFEESTYDEWREKHGVSQDILHEEKVAEALRESYLAEYRRSRKKKK